MIELTRNNARNYCGKCGIYYITVGSHNYVGSSIDLGSRLRNHIWSMENNKHRNKMFQNCYNKYSLSGFMFSILEYCDKDKRIEREQYYKDLLVPDINVVEPVSLERNKPEYINKQREIRLKYYETHEAIGKIPVYYYEKTGEYVGSFSSATEAAMHFGVEVSAITAASNGRSKTCCGYQWSKQRKDNVPSIIKPKKEKPPKDPKPGNSRIIYRYSLDGEYIDCFQSSKAADRALGIHGCHAAANPNTAYRSVGGYMWSFEKKDKLQKYENHSKEARIRSITIKDKDSDWEKTFKSIAEAVRYFNVDDKDFASQCACISYCAKNNKLYQKRFIISYK